MTSVSEFVVNYLVNAAWQIALITAVACLGSLLLRRGPASYRHVLWFVALTASVVVPALTATHAIPATRVVPATRVSRADQSALITAAPATRVSRADQSALITAAPVSEPQLASAPLNSEPILSPLLTTRRTRVVNSAPLTTLWLTLAYALFVAWRMIRLARFLFRRQPKPGDISPDAQEAARRCRAILRIRKVDVAQSSSARVPYTTGAWKPLIVLPRTFCDATEEQLLSVIGHEMAHVARRDYLTNLICELALVPISFHPLAYFIKKQIDRTRELSCDELVSQKLLPPKLYARTLVWAADLTSQTRTEALTLSMFGARNLEERVMRLTRKQKTLSLRLAKVITSLMLFVLCAAAISLSLFSLELKTEARTVFTTPAPAQATNTDAPTPQAETISTQHPRAEPRTPEARTTEIPSTDANAQQRAAAACEVGRNGDTEKIPVLIAMMDDDTKTELLRCWDSGRWSPALETFKHPSPGEQAAIALASMGRAAFQPLTNQLISEDATVRRNAAWAIGELTNMRPGERDGAVPRLITLLSDPDSWVRMAAARALGEVRNHTAVQTLFLTLGDPDARVRQMAVWALSELKDKRDVTPLCNVLLSDLSPEVRRAAAEALGEIRSADALPFLKQALNDSAVRARAQWAINEIEGDE